ncbi:MAG: EthD domain-containing protein [Hyphomicrobium sp.]|nr:EthD domain-containing protein [Hyphomicrobium sp.]
MIRLVRALRRKPGMSRAEFLHYWQYIHGPLVAQYAGVLNIKRYFQLHTLDDPINDGLARDRGGMELPYDGIADVWWMTRDDMTSGFATPEGQAAGALFLEDEKRFLDIPNSALWFSYEYPQVNPSEYIIAREHGPLVKMYYCLRHHAHQNLDAAQLYWRTNHGPLIRSVAEGMRVKRYLQVHYYADPVEQQMRDARGTIVPPYTGHAELWFEHSDLVNFASIPEAKRAMTLAIEDEAKFIDFQRSAMWLGKEHVIIDQR